jgi:hypothetical protein
MRTLRDGRTLKPALNPESCKRSEPYVIWCPNTLRILETQPTEERARHAVAVMLEHAAKHGGDFYTWDLCPEV